MVYNIRYLETVLNFSKKFFLGLMYPFSYVLWAKMPQKLIPNHRTINSKQLLSTYHIATSIFLAIATYTFILFFLLSIHCLYENSAKNESFIRTAPHEHSIIVFLINLLPCVIPRALILPALSSLRGLSPTHDTSFLGVWKCVMSVPVSAIIEVALRSFTPGMVCRFSSSSGNHSLHSAVIFS